MDLENPSLVLNTEENIPVSWPQNPVTPVDKASEEFSETFLQKVYWSNFQKDYQLPWFLEKEENEKQI